MTFAAGDAVHVRGVGKGVVRELRNGGRCLVEINGRSIVTTIDQLTAAVLPKRTGKIARPQHEDRSGASLSLDLHGFTVDEATEKVAAFLNDALLRGAGELRIIHGRSGGKLKAALHRQLKGIASVRSYRVDPQNEGVTVVKL